MGRIHKILIANRGEIAVRVIRTAQKLGIRTVAIYSKIDEDSLHVAKADEAWCIGDIELSDTYLNIPRIVDLAVKTGCDAIHPGYGFLAENAGFVKACRDAGIIFIGPDTEAMRIMGNKIEAREFVKKHGIPMTEGVTGSREQLMATAHKIGFPVLLKAAAGGGGKGMRIVYREDELAEAIESTSRQARSYFGDETVYIEKFIEEPRHIEVQILGDHHGNVVHLFERECSIQRRYQKIIEESPSPTLTPEVRSKMGAAAVAIGKAIGYRNAGTIEFLVDKDLNFYFLEMNTRIQVEHPVTEMVTGVDIVEEQILIASGEPLRFRQEDISFSGHAIECRIYAEDPANNFQPSPGKMTLYREPLLNGIRIDTGITASTEIKSNFDPMICKLIVKGKDRHEAAQLMLQSLREYIIHGIRNNISYLKEILRSEQFLSNAISTKFCDEYTGILISRIADEYREIPLHIPAIGYLLNTLCNQTKMNYRNIGAPNLWQQTGFWRNRMEIILEVDEQPVKIYLEGYAGKTYRFFTESKPLKAEVTLQDQNRCDFTLENRHYTVWISEVDGNQAHVSVGRHLFKLKRNDLLAEAVVVSGFDRHGSDINVVQTPMPGKVIKIMVAEGDEVQKGDALMIIEAMKMENLITAPRDGIVKQLFVTLSDRVESSKTVLELEP